MGVQSAMTVFPWGGRVMYIRRAPAGSSSVAAASVTGSHRCFWLAGSGVCVRWVVLSSVMAADVVPWDAPEAMIDLSSEALMDLGIVPDVIGLD